MKKGTKVSWQLGGGRRAVGRTISDEDSDGTILVAVDDFGLLLPNNENAAWNLTNMVLGPIGFNPVIHCTVISLTIEQ